MDTNETPIRPWWRKRRWRAAGVLWLLVAYPAGMGPVGYAVGRGWLSRPAAESYATPLTAVIGDPDGSAAEGTLRDYIQWWIESGRAAAN